MTFHSSALGVMIGRGLGLVFGLALTVLVAYQFGGDRATDIAFNALVVPNTISAVVASILPPVFLSLLKAVEARSGEREALAYARSVLRLTTLVSLALAAAGASSSPLLAKLVGGGFGAQDRVRLTAFLQVAFLLVLFTAIASVLRGFLNSVGSFFVPGLETLVTNAVAIAVIALTVREWGVFSIVAGMVAGALAKVVLMAPGYLAHGRTAGGVLVHPAVRETVRILFPAMLNSIVYVVNVAVIRALAARIPKEGAVSALNYAERLVNAPYDLVVASLGTVLLASLAQKAAAGDLEGVRRQVSVGLRLSAWFGIPAATGLTLLAEPIVRLVYQHGSFDAGDTLETARTLRASAFLLAFAGLNILGQALYALRATRSILVAGVATAAVNAGLAVALVGRWRQSGLAFAWASSFAVGFAVSLVLFARRAGHLHLAGLVSGVMRTCAATALMGATVWVLDRWAGLHLAWSVGAGMLVFAASSRWLCPEEWGYVSRLWRWPDRLLTSGGAPGA